METDRTTLVVNLFPAVEGIHNAYAHARVRKVLAGQKWTEGHQVAEARIDYDPSKSPLEVIREIAAEIAK